MRGDGAPLDQSTKFSYLSQVEETMGKISISLTDSQLQFVEEAVRTGDYVSSSEVIREALREWKAKRVLGQLWDEGLSDGDADAGETIEDVKIAARQQA